MLNEVFEGVENEAVFLLGKNLSYKYAFGRWTEVGAKSEVISAYW